MLRIVTIAAISLAPLPALSEPMTSVPTTAQQHEFNLIIEKYGTAYSEAANDMAAGMQRPRRAKDICAALGGREVRDWTGFISEVSSNGDGYGVLAVETGKGTTIGTWNNALSDDGYNTLLKPGDPVLDVAATLQPGQAVMFSGTFFRSKTDCITESSLTIRGAMLQPDFVFQFSKLEALGELRTAPKRRSILSTLFD